MTEDNVLLWGVWVENDFDSWWVGSSTKGAALVWDQATVKDAHDLARRIDAKVRPFMTLKQVLDEFNKARAEALKDAPAMQRAIYDQIFKLGGMS